MKKKKAPEPKKVVDAAPKYRPFEALKGLRDQAKSAPEVPPSPPPPPRTRPAVREVDEADLLSFHRMMSGVVPLADDKKARIPRSQERLEPSRARQVLAEGKSKEQIEADDVHEHLRRLVSDDARFEVVHDGVSVEGRRLELPPHTVRTLRRGRLPIDARLDLHGKTSTDAERDLIAFLAKQRANGERCVLVIHGKGAHSPGGRGVLRGEMAAWLSEGRASEHVGAFATALEEDGGGGAMYVLLRR